MEKILVIEDEKNIVLLLKMFLEHNGFEVFTAGNGPDGIKMAQESNPDLILLDIVLPGLNGYMVCRNLKENEKTKNIPVVAISARTSKEDIEKIFSSGAQDYIAKPFSLPQIKKSILKYFKE
jgi:two-component system, OmpR family, alkaline phosphatase synthesis response regulator PhoP